MFQATTGVVRVTFPFTEHATIIFANTPVTAGSTFRMTSSRS